MCLPLPRRFYLKALWQSLLPLLPRSAEHLAASLALCFLSSGLPATVFWVQFGQLRKVELGVENEIGVMVEKPGKAPFDRPPHCGFLWVLHSLGMAALAPCSPVYQSLLHLVLWSLQLLSGFTRKLPFGRLSLIVCCVRGVRFIPSRGLWSQVGLALAKNSF